MNRIAGLVSYLLNIVAVALYPPVYVRIVGPEATGSLGFSYVYLAMLSIFAMVLLPYFEVASFIESEGGYWKEVSRLIHRHISIPFIGGYSISVLAIYPSGFIFGLYGGYGSGTFSGIQAVYDPILAGYLLFVFVASLITIMANRKPKSSDVAVAQTAQPGP